MAFNIGLSGIRAASTDLEVRGNNISNASTTGFKESRTEFSDVYTTSLLGTGIKPVGSGVMVDNVRQQFSQGNISSTQNSLDMAIDGNGFFVLNDQGSVSYSRAGIFSLDKDGYVVANNGSRLQGYEANANGLVNGVLGDIQIQVANQAPRLTSQVSAIVNLDAGQSVLQEQGLQLVANGLAIGAADAGIIEDTNTVLATAMQPTTAGTPARVTFTGNLLTLPGTGTPAQLATAGAAASLDFSAAGASANFDVVVSSNGTPTITNTYTVTINAASLTNIGANLANVTPANIETLIANRLANATDVVASGTGPLTLSGAGPRANGGTITINNLNSANLAPAPNLANFGFAGAASNTGTARTITALNDFSITVDNRTVDIVGANITIGDNRDQNIQNVVTAVQQALDMEAGLNEYNVRFSAATGNPQSSNLIIERAGVSATDGSGLAVQAAATPGDWNTLIGDPTTAVSTAATEGSRLFVGSNPLTADFRSIPGTSTTTRTTATPPLNIVASSPGDFATLTAGSIYSSLNVSTATGTALSFSIATETGATYPINLSEASWSVATPPADFANVTLAETIAEINAQITAASGAGNEQVLAESSSGSIHFRVLSSPPVAPLPNAGYGAASAASRGDFLQLGGNGVNLDRLGFASSNRFNGGVEPVLANNEFQLEVTSSTGNAGGPFTLTIPPASYASLDDLAVTIQQQIDTYVGASGLAGKVSVDAVGGQLVFTNTRTGSTEGLAFSSTVAQPQALNALGLNSTFVVSGQNEIDRSNSFRINLTVPAPDSDNRSGSVLISLDEEYRSVQQLASSINRQLNSQDADNYIGVRAEAVEVEPRVVPPQFQLRLSAVEGGESSIISVSDFTASGDDVTTGDMFGLLQFDPGNSGLLTTGIAGVSNEYPEQRVTLTDPDGNETVITIPEDSEANEIVSLFNKQPGVTTSALTTMTIPLTSYNSPGNDMRLTVNGQALTSTSIPDLVTEINSYRATTLPGFNATTNEAGDLIITNEIGRDIRIEMTSPVVTDSLVVQGAENTGPVVLGGNLTADTAAAVGGVVTFTLNANFTLNNPEPVVSGIFGALTEDEFTPFTLNAFDPTDQNTYNHATSTTIYDSLGNPHVMTQYFVKEPLDPERPTEQNLWAMYVQIDGQEVGDPDAALPFPQNLEPTRYRRELFFNQDGSLDTDATGDIFVTNWDPRDADGNLNGAISSANVLEGGLPLSEPPTNSNFQIDLAGSTQFGSPFSVNEVNQNGFTTGRLTGLEVDNEGVIFARFTNGQAQTLGQVALGTFRNPEGLTPLGDTGWAESFESGVVTIGSPRTASFGQIRSSALEDSNVDLSEELVGLIIAQRNFQASSKTIETVDQVTQTILQI